MKILIVILLVLSVKGHAVTFTCHGVNESGYTLLFDTSSKEAFLFIQDYGLVIYSRGEGYGNAVLCGEFKKESERQILRARMQELIPGSRDFRISYRGDMERTSDHSRVNSISVGEIRFNDHNRKAMLRCSYSDVILYDLQFENCTIQ